MSDDTTTPAVDPAATPDAAAPVADATAHAADAAPAAPVADADRKSVV